MKNLHRPSELISFLKNNNKLPKKGLSQNFLIDKNIVLKIIDIANIKPNDLILEIGPGPGVLTEAILEKNAIVIAVEKDTFFANELKKNTSENLKVYEKDFLKFDFQSLKKKNIKIKVIANLPYSITSPILNHLFANNELFSDIIIMVQKEVAEKIVHKPTDRYLNLMINYFSKPKYCFSVSKNCFLPRPKVDSAVISLKVKNNIKRDEKFLEMLKFLFSQKRKTAFKSLKQFFENVDISKLFKEFNIDQNIRPQEMSIDLFEKIYQYVIRKCS